MLRLAATLDELEKGLVGRAIVGRSFLAWCLTPKLVGTVHFGRRDASDAQTLAQLYRIARHSTLRPPLRRVVDGRALQGVDDDAWNYMMGVVMQTTEQLTDLFERQAVIVEPTIHGARTAALLPALGPRDQFRVFSDPDEAYRWVDPQQGPTAMRDVQALLDEVGSIGDIAGRARAWIAAHLRDARIGACASALAVSTRSLQRQLTAAGLTFRGLVAEQRVVAAEARLVHGAAKIEAIARDVGCSSASQLSVLLRRAGRKSPSDVRGASSRRGR